MLRVRVFLSILAFSTMTCSFVHAQTPPDEISKLFAQRVGSFVLLGSPTVKTEQAAGAANESAAATYSADGKRVTIQLLRFNQDADAYSRLTVEAQAAKTKESSLNVSSTVGTASFLSKGQLAFCKGSYFVRITSAVSRFDVQSLTEFAQNFATKLDKGEGEVPVLVQHLPAWQDVQKNVLFLSRFDKTLPEYPALNVIDSERDADAVIADYGSSKLLIVEFHTPQLAAENDQRIVAKIHELWKAGESAPSAYRRVGNYSVFVFNSPDEQSAKQLIDQVKYEQVVQWLGQNPYLLKEAEKRYAETTLGVFVAVLKASGFALIGCFAAGGLFGALLFTRRRAQQQGLAAFSDAGGMLRLNIDELTPQTNPARLLRERN